MSHFFKSALLKKGILGFSYFIGSKIKNDFKLSPEERVITYPTMGRKNTSVIKKHLEHLGLNILLPPPTTDRTIKIGVRNSPDMMCFPYKVTLGNFVEALEDGANTLIIFNSSGKCRFRQYSKLHEYTLRGMGYNFEIHNVSISDIIPKLSKLSGKSLSKCYNTFSEYLKETKEIDSEVKQWSEDKPNIGIIGEIFCACDEKINYGLESKIKKFGGNPYNTARVGDFLSDLIKRKLKIYNSSFFDYILKEPLKNYKREAKKFFNGELGGHAFENIYNLLYLADRGVDGIIHILPLSCFSEDTLITMEDYTQKLIKEVNKGDNVLTHKGNIKKVIKTLVRRYNGQILKIDCGGISKIKITLEHPIFSIKKIKVRSNNQIKINPTFIKAEELRKGDFIAIPKPNIILDNSFIKSEMVNLKKPKYKDMDKFNINKGMLRLLGYYLAEGSLFYDSNKNKQKPKKYLSSVRFTFNVNENNYIQDIISIIKENKIESLCKVYTNKKRPNTLDLSVTNRSLAYFLKRLGERYCDKKQISNDLLNIPNELQLEIAKGFFRGDGCLTNKYGETTYRAVTTSFKLASQIYWILIRNNIRCSIMPQDIKNRKKSYLIKISNANGINRFKDENIKTIYRINKVRFLESKTHFFIPVLKLSKEKFNGNVYNLEVEGDNSYVANLLAVHNCMPESTIEPYIDGICRDRNIPKLRLHIDETNSPANIETRLETFVELIKWKRKKHI